MFYVYMPKKTTSNKPNSVSRAKLHETIFINKLPWFCSSRFVVYIVAQNLTQDDNHLSSPAITGRIKRATCILKSALPEISFFGLRIQYKPFGYSQLCRKPKKLSSRINRGLEFALAPGRVYHILPSPARKERSFKSNE